MNDVIDPTPSPVGLDRFTAELGDVLRARAQTLPERGPATSVGARTDGLAASRSRQPREPP
jgi:hypothetical protein